MKNGMKKIAAHSALVRKREGLMSKHMINAILFLLLLQSAHAAPIKLSCVVDGYKKGNEYIVDIEKSEVASDLIKLKIIQIDQAYITAIHLPSNSSINAKVIPITVGGRIWVLNRKTGEFKEVWIGLGFREGESIDQMGLETYAFGGKCSKPLL